MPFCHTHPNRGHKKKRDAIETEFLKLQPVSPGRTVHKRTSGPWRIANPTSVVPIGRCETVDPSGRRSEGIMKRFLTTCPERAGVMSLQPVGRNPTLARTLEQI